MVNGDPILISCFLKIFSQGICLDTAVTNVARWLAIVTGLAITICYQWLSDNPPPRLQLGRLLRAIARTGNCLTAPLLTRPHPPILTNADSFWLDVPGGGESMPFNFFQAGRLVRFASGRVDVPALNDCRWSGYYSPRTGRVPNVCLVCRR